MSRDFLQQVIRSYGSAHARTCWIYLEQSLKLFASHQRDTRERGKGDGDALQVMASLAQNELPALALGAG